MGHQGPKVASLCLLLPAFLSCRAQLQCGEPGTSGSGVGVEQLFVIWTDYKNLHSARHLHSHQAHWAPFLGHFNYTLTYCPGSHNIKPEALSRRFAPEGPPFEPETILSLWFNALNPTQVMVCTRFHQVSNPSVGTFVQDVLSSWLQLYSQIPQAMVSVAHNVQRHNIQRHLLLCGCLLRLCTRQITPSTFCWLVAPSSHSQLHDYTSQWSSEGNITILIIMIIVECYSKAVHFFPLPKLLSGLETTDLLMLHAFLLHGIPQDNVPDHSPQSGLK